MKTLRENLTYEQREEITEGDRVTQSAMNN